MLDLRFASSGVKAYRRMGMARRSHNNKYIEIPGSAGVVWGAPQGAV
jgi:hypothetical protein